MTACRAYRLSASSIAVGACEAARASSAGGQSQPGRSGRSSAFESCASTGASAGRSSASTQPPSRASIWDVSEGGIQSGRWSAVSHALASRCRPSRCRSMASARLTTQHQMGTVFVSASGKRLPLRVESTRTTPPARAAASATWRLSRDSEKPQHPTWPSVDLK